MHAELLKNLPLELGEGPLWDGTHLWFFDILAPKMYRMSGDGAVLESWEAERMASAAARTTTQGVLIATETDLMLFDPAAQTVKSLCPLEADKPETRSNDGRADRQGGFWIGTMGKEAEPGAGALYRYYKGELRCLKSAITIPNSICFSPAGDIAYFSDSFQQRIFFWTLGPDGWPEGEPAVFYDVEGGDAGPDGAVVDAEGHLWVAMWGASMVLRLTPGGVPVAQVDVPVNQPSCPALTPEGRMYITTAREGLTLSEIADAPLSGSIFVADVPVGGLPEPEVIL